MIEWCAKGGHCDTGVMKLVRFLMRLSGETLTVELKDGSTVHGSLAGMDPHMNAHMRTVTLTPAAGGAPAQLARLTVRGSAIRTILLPDALALDPLLVDDRPRAVLRAGPSVPGASIRGARRGGPRFRGGAPRGRH